MVLRHSRYYWRILVRPADHASWTELREQLAYRQEVRRAQLRFRRQPEVYLAAPEEQLLKASLLS